MVNVPPIPPLLCSTPPPIDFGEEDDDVDVLPPTLNGVDDDDFGDFLTVNDTKTNEPIPSPRPPSVCDSPPGSIYDGLITSDQEQTNHTLPSTPPSPPSDNDKISKDSENLKKSIPLTEAFNYDVKNTHADDGFTQKENENPPEYLKATENTIPVVVETINNKLVESNSENEKANGVIHSGISSSNKNIRDLTIETENVESKCSNKISLSSIQNMVSIEDLEDDLSDDELYSPKAPKNFIETDNLNDYFKIEEVKISPVTGKVAKTDSKYIGDISLDSLDNNDSASLGNDNDYKSFSSNSYVQNNSDMPPPLQDNFNSIDDDDFGDFADFQDFSTTIAADAPPSPPAEIENFVNKTVPVNDINSKQNNNNRVELNSFNNFIDYNTTKEYEDVNTAKKELITENYKSDIENIEEELDDFDDSTPHIPTLAEKNSKQNSLELDNITQEISNDIEEASNLEDCKQTSSVKGNIEQSNFNVDDSFGDFNAATETEVQNEFGNFAEFPQNEEEDGGSELKADSIEESIQVSENISNDGDEFNDFADFESHQEVSKSEEKHANEVKINKETSCSSNDIEDGEEDDDFGDFNTAQPITPTASSIKITKTSQHTIAATIALPPSSSSHNLNERISKILQLMFIPPITKADETNEEPKTAKIQDIPFTSIDAAKALEYQWLNSDTRHSFIRSLGIDSRNILYGENWNPSLPRFAANLSFNPLKPMKPVQSTITVTDSNGVVLEPVPINNLETTKTLDACGSTKNETLDIDWKSSSTGEQTTKAFTDITLNQENDTASVPFISNEPPPTEPVPLTIFENPLDSEDKFSKTPPISEMESVTTFSSPLPVTTIDMELPITQLANNLAAFDLNEVEENLKNNLNINEVVVTSTFTGSFKETHIYTPPKTNEFENKQIPATTPTLSTSPTKASPIDFDYEKAAMGVIIDETVVKKEYRDVEYNPPFTMESLSKSVPAKTDMFEANTYANTNANILSATDVNITLDEAPAEDDQEFNDDFSEFQSVSSEVIPAALPNNTVGNTKPLEVPKNTTVAHGGMILSPAILIPQAISLENQKPKIEWGDSTATINPEELARIEELFPEPKSLKSSSASNSSQKSTPTHQVASTPSISATVACKELEGNINDDDDWSDFVSVTITNNGPTNRTLSNNNVMSKSPTGSPFKQRSPVVSHRIPSGVHNSNNDDEWSEFVSSAPASQQPASYRVPQFNSGAWQNANFYNNPLSMYHKGPINVPTAATGNTSYSAQKSLYNNNNNYNISQQPYQIANNIPPATLMANNQQTTCNAYQQQIHVMQNFSTAPVPTPERIAAAAAAAKNNQFQSIGSAKVAPSIALIPDLGFVAPAIPTHTSFINSLPKPSINTKK